MNRNRSAVIVIKDGKVLLMHRINKGDEYWVFPGGGVEEGETPEEAAVRELYEETTITAVIKKELYHITWDNGGEFFFYLCDYVSGEPQLHPDSIEKEQMKKGDQFFEPLWVSIDTLSQLKLYQLEIRDLFIEDYKNNFPNDLKKLFIVIAERRHQ